MTFSKRYLLAFFAIIATALIVVIFTNIEQSKKDCVKSENQLHEDFFQRNVIITDKTQFSWFGENITFWNPIMNDIELADSIILDAVRTNRNEYWARLDEETLKFYFKQYSFIITESKDSIIHVNAFCNIPEVPTDSSGVFIMRKFDWKDKLLHVEDGGDCFWNITISKTKKKCIAFSVNGI